MTGHQWMHVVGVVGVALSCWVILAIAMCAAYSHAARSHRRRQPAPEFEASAYVAPICNAHRPHQYALTEDGTAYVCVRCQQRVQRVDVFDRELADLDDIETYANQGGAA